MKTNKLERYVSQLIIDLFALHKEKSPDTSSANKKKNPLGPIEFMEPDFENALPFKQTVGIDPSVFPPFSQLSTVQVKRLIDAIRGLFYSFDADITIPPAMNLEERYQLHIKAFDTEIPAMNLGTFYLDFCDGSGEDCPLDKYCNCTEPGFVANQQNFFEDMLDEMKKHISSRLPHLVKVRLDSISYGELVYFESDLLDHFGVSMNIDPIFFKLSEKDQKRFVLKMMGMFEFDEGFSEILDQCSMEQKALILFHLLMCPSRKMEDASFEIIPWDMRLGYLHIEEKYWRFGIDY